jgi:hypothetical protein
MFDLVSTLFHELEQAKACERFLWDAREVGDFELAEFFLECRRASETVVSRAKELLDQRLSLEHTARDAAAEHWTGEVARAQNPDDERVDEGSRESFPASDAPAY